MPLVYPDQTVSPSSFLSKNFPILSTISGAISTIRSTVDTGGTATGITRVVVTHRLEASLLECYDEIFVLKDGRIAEIGTFAELVQHGGYFSAMYKLAH